MSGGARCLGGMRGQREEREEQRTELVLLLRLLLLALEGSEVGEEIPELLGRLWGVTGLLEVADTLWRW